MKIPRLRYWDSFYIFQDGMWQSMTPEDVVAAFNGMAERYEIILSDIEEIICGHPSRADRSVHPGTASTA